MAVNKVVFLRHGESVWNVENIFTGWVDVDLSPTGELEALEAGRCLKSKGFKFDLVFTSVLRRAIKTAWKACMESDNFAMPVINSWRLNERHYGGLQGKNKAETAKLHGEEQVKIWRRSYDIPPPQIDPSDPMHPGNDPMYANVPTSALPGAESLKITVDRVLPFWNDHIAPCIMAGKTVMVAAHGNSLRALCKYIEGMSEADVLDLNIPTAVPLVYELDENLGFIKKYYLMDPAEVAAKMAAVANQAKGGMPAPVLGGGSGAFGALGACVAQLLKHPKIAGLDSNLVSLNSASEADGVRSMCFAFLKALAGDTQATYFLKEAGGTKFSEAASFFLEGLERVKIEISAQAAADPNLEAALKAAATGDASGSIAASEAFWKVFFPGGVGMMGGAQKAMDDLKAKRKVTIEKLNPNPIKDPVKEMIFTSNVLLGLPPSSKAISSLPYSEDFKGKLDATTKEKQLAWFDHPIQIGVEPAGNEILYGLKGLDSAVGWEKENGKISADAQMLTALSITCTHAGLRSIAKQYVEEEFKAMPEAEKIKHLKILLFSEIETDEIIDKVLKPACAKIGVTDMEPIRTVFGVEGQYGRHYTFLKAILAVYNTFIDPAVRATFKIDIDQVFIQESLMAETGTSMIEHFKTDLWGASGKNWKGEDIELGMIAGALCNQNDWEANDKKLFVADVKMPPSDKKLAADEVVFFSGLPQAISTEAEMMTKYNDPKQDAIQRIHVTGGTNGILVEHLFKIRPFAPSWIGRAEDQSYIFSTFHKSGPKLGYVHKPGLIMRHDKEAFAFEAMEAARIGKMVGDYERILLFSEYAKACSPDFKAAKELVDPFTGCFCVPIKYTTTYLRFALKALGFYAGGKPQDAVDFTMMGAPRVADTVKFVKADGGPSELEKSFKAEVKAWDDFYNALEAARGDAAISAACKEIIDKATCQL